MAITYHCIGPWCGATATSAVQGTLPTGWFNAGQVGKDYCPACAQKLFEKLQEKYGKVTTA